MTESESCASLETNKRIDYSQLVLEVIFNAKNNKKCETVTGW